MHESRAAAVVRAGDWVRLKILPPGIERLPAESREVSEFCLGRVYRVDEIDGQGPFVLDVSADIDARFGGYMNDMRMEADCLEAVANDAREAQRRQTP